MARAPRIDVGNEVYHVINRANGGLRIFNTVPQYQDFEYLLNEMRETFGMRILAYVIMSNHWHLLLYPINDGDLSKSMQWLGTTHTRRYHTQTHTVGGGHLYQGRYKSFLVENDRHLLTVLKYIERNPTRAKLVEKPEEWQWGSAFRRLSGTDKEKKLLAESPTELPNNYHCWLHDPESSEAVTEIRHSIKKGVPYGSESWVDAIVERHHLDSTQREPGRPRQY